MDVTGKIGILGGTFDPIHMAHLKLAEYALSELELTKVIFIPAAVPPHKRNRMITDSEHRFNMTKLAIGYNDRFEVSDMELKMDGASYTARTLSILYEENPNLCFILGADSYMALDTWFHPEIIMAKAQIACACRDGIPTAELKCKAGEYGTKYGAVTHFLSMPDTDISSTMLRQMISEGKDVKQYIPEQVMEYIRTNNLYTKQV